MEALIATSATALFGVIGWVVHRQEILEDRVASLDTRWAVIETRLEDMASDIKEIKERVVA